MIVGITGETTWLSLRRSSNRMVYSKVPLGQVNYEKNTKLLGLKIIQLEFQ